MVHKYSGKLLALASLDELWTRLFAAPTTVGIYVLPEDGAKVQFGKKT